MITQLVTLLCLVVAAAGTSAAYFSLGAGKTVKAFLYGLAGIGAGALGVYLALSLSIPMLILLGLELAFIAYLVKRALYWWGEGKKLQLPGYLPPPPSIYGRSVQRFMTRVLSFTGIGPVKVIGRQNADFAGRLMVNGNHQFEYDFAAVGTALPHAYRHLGVASEMTGLRGAMSAFGGFFSVPGEAGKAKSHAGAEAVIDASARVLLSDTRTRLLVFPQGKLDRENELNENDFRTGSIRMLHKAHELATDDVPLALLPMAIYYKRDPRQRTTMHWLASSLGLKWFRSMKTRDSQGNKIKVTNYGAVVVIGEPIPYSSFTPIPKDASDEERHKMLREQTEMVRRKILELFEIAKAAA